MPPRLLSPISRRAAFEKAALLAEQKAREAPDAVVQSERWALITRV